MKICSNCRCSKPPSEFHVRSATRDKLQAFCKLCSAKARKKNREKDLEASRKTSAKWHAANRDRLSERKRLKYADPEVKKAKQAYGREYYANNRPKVNLRNTRRYASNPAFRIKRLLGKRLWSALKLGGAVKSAKTVELLGAPWVWVEAYLEEQFVPGMSWENHGPVWHIDHIRPCASFDLTDPEQQRICFHWTNLQPLFAAENISKGAKYDPLNV